MSKVYTSVLDLIGHTPLLEPKKLQTRTWQLACW